MSVKPWVAFTTSLPDDQVEDGRKILVVGGRNVAVAIGEIFTRLGCKAAPPESAGELGWEFELRYEGGRRFWCRVTSFYPAFHLLFEDAAARGLSRSKNADAYAELAQGFAAALKNDPRFRNVSWWSFKDGPPEPDEVVSAAATRGATKNSGDPIDKGRGANGRPAWGCLAFALYVLLSGIFALFMAVMGGTREPLGEMLSIGVSLIVLGLFGLMRASAERVYK